MTAADYSARARRSIGSRDVTEWRSRSGRRLVDLQRRVRRRLGRTGSLLATGGVGLSAAVAATWATTLLYDAVADHDGISRIDRPVLRAAQRLRNPPLDTVAAVLAEGFGPVGMPALTLAAGTALALRRRQPEPLIVVCVTGIGSLAMTLGGKRVVERHRPARRDAVPPFERSPSFPSGHTLNATAIGGAVAYLAMLDQRTVPPQVATAALAAGTAAAVGGSRILLGAHWATDVITGWVLGAGWLTIVVTGDRLRRTLDRPADDEPAPGTPGPPR